MKKENALTLTIILALVSVGLFLLADNNHYLIQHACISSGCRDGICLPDCNGARSYLSAQILYGASFVAVLLFLITGINSFRKVISKK